MWHTNIFLKGTRAPWRNGFLKSEGGYKMNLEWLIPESEEVLKSCQKNTETRLVERSA
jgi:hypothetical protein